MTEASDVGSKSKLSRYSHHNLSLVSISPDGGLKSKSSLYPTAPLPLLLGKEWNCLTYAFHLESHSHSLFLTI